MQATDKGKAESGKGGKDAELVRRLRGMVEHHLLPADGFLEQVADRLEALSAKEGHTSNR